MSTPGTNRASQASSTFISRANRALTRAAMASRARARAASLSLFAASAAGSFMRFLLALALEDFAAALFNIKAESDMAADTFGAGLETKLKLD